MKTFPSANQIPGFNVSAVVNSILSLFKSFKYRE